MAIIRLQQTSRMWKIRKNYLNFSRAIIILQANHRQRHTAFVYRLIISLVSVIQSQIRGFLRRIIVKRLIRERVKMYRLQIFDLWRRTFTPLTYRSKFWAMSGTGFLQLALHEEELARLWRLLGVTVQRSATVFEKYTQVQQLVNSVKNKNNMIVPVFAAELEQRMDLILAEKALKTERDGVYKKMKHEMGKEQQMEIFKLFNLGMGEEKKKDRIVKSLWEYRGLAKQSAIFILRLNNDEDHLNKRTNPNRRQISFRNPSFHPNATNSNYVQAKLDHRIKNDLLASLKACMRQLNNNKVMSDEERRKMKHQRAIADGVEGSDWMEKRMVLIKRYFEGTCWMSDNDNWW